MEWITLSYKNNDKNNNLTTGIQLINICIGVILTLICLLVYITIDSEILRQSIIGLVIVVGLITCIVLIEKSNRMTRDRDAIKSIALINEENEIIREWELWQKVAMVIGKETSSNYVDIDLKDSIYSNLIEDEHAVLNYAGGTWYVEDLCSENGVGIKKIDDGIQYRAVKNSPCRIKKGDILFIGKTKLLLKWNGVG